MSVGPLPSSASRGWGFAALAYAVFIVYGSLYPFSGWTSEVVLFAFLTPRWSDHVSLSDVVTNVVAYMLLGFMLVRWLRGRGRRAGAAVAAISLSALLSFAMEFGQQFIPVRVASLIDLIANTLGAALGAVLEGFIQSDSLPWTMLMQRRNRWFQGGPLVDLGLAAIGLWALSQLMPLVPSLDVSTIRHGLSLIWRTFQHPARFNVPRWLTYALYLAGLALLAVRMGSPGQGVFARFFVFVGCVLLCKIFIVTRQLSLEAACGAMLAIVLALPFLAVRGTAVAAASAVFILAGFAVSEVAKPLSWVPLATAMEDPLTGIASALEELWPAAALASLVRLATPRSRAREVGGIGAVAIGVVVFLLEWYQQYVLGQSGDFTVVVLSTGTWLLFWLIPARDTVTGNAEHE